LTETTVARSSSSELRQAEAPALPPGLPPRQSIADTFREIFTDIRTYRELLLELARRDIRIRYKQAVMGFGWAIFMPILIVASGVLVRVAMGQMSGSGVGTSDVAGIAVKGIAWAFFVGTITFATTTLTTNHNLISKVYFPREVLPLSSLLAQCFDTAIGLIALAVLLPFLGVTLQPNLLWAPLLLFMLFLVTAAATLFLSCANLFFRDVKYIVQVLLTFGIFFTPVFYEPAMMGERGATLMQINPLSPILEGLRLSVVEGHNLLVPLTVTGRGGAEIVAWNPLGLLYAGAWGTIGLALSALVFHRLEPAFAENV
jgi:ABC-type polysaccharide/polyol phosphate export permease